MCFASRCIMILCITKCRKCIKALALLLPRQPPLTSLPDAPSTPNMVQWNLDSSLKWFSSSLPSAAMSSTKVFQKAKALFGGASWEHGILVISNGNRDWT